MLDFPQKLSFEAKEKTFNDETRVVASLTVEVTQKISVGELKNKIETELGVFIKNLVFRGKTFPDDETLGNIHLRAETRLASWIPIKMELKNPAEVSEQEKNANKKYLQKPPNSLSLLAKSKRIDIEGINENMTVLQLKEKIHNQEGIPVEQIFICAGGQMLVDGDTLGKVFEKLNYCVEAFVKMYLFVRLKVSDVLIEENNKNSFGATSNKSFPKDEAVSPEKVAVENIVTPKLGDNRHAIYSSTASTSADKKSPVSEVPEKKDDSCLVM